MKLIPYKSFSWDFHKKNWQRGKPNVCQFEITFKCDFHCKYCYSDCYNNPYYIDRELSTKEVKLILDKIYKAGVIWLCFTGGDPLTRNDFLDIYSYVKRRGFIITVFTNGYSINKEIIKEFKKKPPFVIEITLNTVTKSLYENIVGLSHSFEKVMENVRLILEAKLPLKIKTQVIKDNLEEIPNIKKYIRSLGLVFRPTVLLNPRLNGDPYPCSLRISPQQALNIFGNRVKFDDGCDIDRFKQTNKNLFRCAIGGGDGVHIDPYGNIFPCLCIREPKVNLLKEDFKVAREKILTWLRSRDFTYESKCKMCSVGELCYRCPGKALLEVGDMEAPIPYFCDFAQEIAKRIYCRA
ncbi:MAG: radical SAM protein [Candidatus Omnitrophica bacterium]|nr:radical SAM protein [Candidatus Omnitrophota bacterium]